MATRWNSMRQPRGCQGKPAKLNEYKAQGLLEPLVVATFAA